VDLIEEGDSEEDPSEGEPVEDKDLKEDFSDEEPIEEENPEEDSEGEPIEEEDPEEDSKVSEGQLMGSEDLKGNSSECKTEHIEKENPKGIRKKKGGSSLYKITKPKDYKAWVKR